jgi:hypothetical protein
MRRSVMLTISAHQRTGMELSARQRETELGSTPSSRATAVTPPR